MGYNLCSTDASDQRHVRCLTCVGVRHGHMSLRSNNLFCQIITGLDVLMSCQCLC